MGAYLSTPVREKESRDFEGEFLSFGASSMQGWRMTQEDAHSCQVDFDAENKTSLFAVYDGHGGAEVAQYSALNFPEYLKRITQYEKGLIKEALEEAFLGFDATLTEENVIRQLKDLAGVGNDTEDVEEVKNEAVALREEASMPLEKVLERYGGPANTGSCLLSKNMYSLRKRPKFLSPVVKTKVPTLGSSDSEQSGVESSELSEASPSCKTSDLDEVKIKLDDKITNGFCENIADSCQSDIKDGSSSEPSSSAIALDETPSSSDNKGPHEIGLTSEDSTNCPEKAAAENGSGSHVSLEDSGCSSSKEICSETSVKSSTSESLSKTLESDAAGPSSSSASNSGAEKDEEESEEDTEEEQDSDEDEDKWNSEEAEDSDEEDDDMDGFNVDDDDDDDDEEEEEEDGTMNPMGWNEEPGADSGCTAVVALLIGRTLYVANAGDSRCVVCRDGMAVEMSADHKPEDAPETERIIKAGGKVTCDGRVNGGLNLSRALGDHSYKQNKSLSAREQMITALPDVRSIEVTEKDRFMVLACDGIWNVMSSQDVVDFVQKRLDSDVTKLSTICEEMFEVCLAPDTTGDGTGCDNMTCVIVRFNKLHDNNIEASRKRKADEETEDCSVAKRVKELDDDSKDS